MQGCSDGSPARRRELQLVRVQQRLHARNVGMYFDGINFANQFEDRRSPRSRESGLCHASRGAAGRVAPTYTNGMASPPIAAAKRPLSLLHGPPASRTRSGNCWPRWRRQGVHLDLAGSQGQAKNAGGLVCHLFGEPEGRRPGLPEIVDVTQYRTLSAWPSRSD